MFTQYNGATHYILQKASDYVKTLTTKGEVYIPMSEIKLIYDIEFIVYHNIDIPGARIPWEVPLEYGNVKKDYVMLISNTKLTSFKKGGDGKYRYRLPLNKAKIFAVMEYHVYGGKALQYRAEEPIAPEYFFKIFSDHLNAMSGRIVGTQVMA